MDSPVMGGLVHEGVDRRDGAVYGDAAPPVHQHEVPIPISSGGYLPDLWPRRTVLCGKEVSRFPMRAGPVGPSSFRISAASTKSVDDECGEEFPMRGRRHERDGHGELIVILRSTTFSAASLKIG